MGKRIFATLLLLTLLLPLAIPGSAQAAEEDLESLIQEQIEEYAATLFSDTTPTAGKSALLRHAIFGGGKDLIVDEESQLTAALMNSAVLQECLRYSCANMIRYMQDANLDIIYGYGGANWYSSYCAYSMSAYLNEIPMGQIGQGEYVGGAASSSALYGEFQFDTPLNVCDKALTSVIGSCNTRMSIKRIRVGENTAAYQVTINVSDNFDFDGSYENSGSSGMDTSVEEELTQIGGALAAWLVKPFHWESSASISLEIPYSCAHFQGNYQWTYDSQNRQLLPETSEGIILNPAKKMEYVLAVKTRVYHELENPVHLLHNSPWVLEYDVSGAAYFSMGTLDNRKTALPFLCHYSNNYVFIGQYIRARETQEAGSAYVDEHYRYGASTNFARESGHVYTYRYENVISNDGSNMIYVSVYDKTADQQMVAPRPMNDLYMFDGYEGLEDQNRKADWVNGKDLAIKYIGVKQEDSIPASFCLRIWTDGKESGGWTAFEDGYIQPSCTEPGGKAQVCALCGYYELTEPTEPLGHSFGEYVSNGDADCVNDGTKTAECTVCGVEDTVVDEGSVYGHEFRKYYSDNNATCTSDGTKTAECKYCDVTDTVPDPGTMLPHSYEAVVTLPTCTEGGFTTHTCTCGDSYIDSYVEALGHEIGAWETVKEPNYLENGLKEKHCSRCEAYETEEIPNNPFTDVGEGNSFKTEILWAYYNNITTGTGDGTTFAPLQDVNRGQFVTFLWRAAGSPEPKSQENPFTDVNENNRFLQAILWAYHEGITTGTTATTFSPNNTCTRGQVVMFLYRYGGGPEGKNVKNPFTDVTAGNRFYDAIMWAVDKGITTGKTPTTFEINSHCTRTQVVTFLYRFLEEK